MAPKTQTNDLLQRVAAIAPIIQAHAARAESERQLAPQVVQAMRDQGFFRMWKPRAYGGLELDPISGFRVLERLAELDSTVSWNLQITAGIDIILQWFGEEALNELFDSDSEVIVAGTWHPPGEAVATADGYRVSGHWRISSGCQYANWYFLNAVVKDGDTVKTYDNGQPVVLFILLPAGEGKVHESWNTIGMKGTGSHDIVLEDVFIPQHRTTPMAPIERPSAPAYQGPLYNNSVWYAIAALAAPALGIGRAALNEARELILQKTPNYQTEKLQEKPIMQSKLAEAETILRAGRAYLFQTLQQTWDSALLGQRISTEQRMELQMASTYAVQSAAKSIRLVHEISGLTAMRESARIQRHFRDIHVITQHAFISQERYRAVGQLMLGREPDWGFFYF